MLRAQAGVSVFPTDTRQVSEKLINKKLKNETLTLAGNILLLPKTTENKLEKRTDDDKYVSVCNRQKVE
jgi:hypothetical protein